MATAIDHSIPGKLTSPDATKAARCRLHDFHVCRAPVIDFHPLLEADRMATKTIYQNPYLRLVGKLREHREILGISQTQLAAHLGWPQQRISSIESGSRRLDVLEFCQMASALGVSPAEVSDLICKALKAVRVPRIN